jgi:hypothetical protein
MLHVAYLYDRATLPSVALESRPWASSANVTIHRGSDLAHTKKFCKTDHSTAGA